MDELIKRSTAMDALTDKNIIDYMDSVQDGELHRVKRAVRRIIRTLHTEDAVPVRHGRWIMHIDDLFPIESTMECSKCHEHQPLTCDDNFCPNCGAIMDGKDEEHDT